jgi:predicted O-methyltransferase YrrM
MVTDIIDPVLDAYAAEHTTAPPRYLEDLAEDLRATLQFPNMMVGRLEGRFLELVTFALGAHHVLEIGTFGGYSALSMAAGLAPGGRITTLEISPAHAEFARRHIAASPYRDQIEVVVGPALDSITSLEGPFDLVFIDADKENNAGYLEWAVKLTHPGSVVVVDNVIRDGAILSPDGDAVVQGTRRALELMGENPRLDTAVLQTVGAKHWDGFAFALVK